MVCDGSFQHRKLSSAFMSMSNDPIVGTNIVPFRGEINGWHSRGTYMQNTK
jgi:hypothetical protein